LQRESRWRKYSGSDHLKGKAATEKTLGVEDTA